MLTNGNFELLPQISIIIENEKNEITNVNYKARFVIYLVIGLYH